MSKKVDTLVNLQEEKTSTINELDNNELLLFTAILQTLGTAAANELNIGSATARKNIANEVVNIFFMKPNNRLIDENDDVIRKSDFIHNVKIGVIDVSDGFARYATNTHITNIPVMLNKIDTLDKNYEYIAWFNK